MTNRLLNSISDSHQKSNDNGDLRPIVWAEPTREGVRVASHKLLEKIIDELPRSKHRETIANELRIGFLTYCKRGEFSYNVKRLKHLCKRGAERFQIELNRVARLAKEYIRGEFSRAYKFKLPILTKRDPDNDLLPGEYRYWIPDEYLCYRTVSQRWIDDRHEKWSEWCLKNNLPQSFDHDGETPWGKAILESLDRVRIPCACPDPDVQRVAQYAAEGRSLVGFFDSQCGLIYRLTTEGVKRYVSRRGGRANTPVSGMSREVRAEITIDGEAVTECDLHASYWCFLVSMLVDGEEKSRAIAALQSNWYKQFDYSCLPQGSNEKVEFQKQCLFGRDRRAKSNPLWHQLKAMYPQLAKLIAELRKKYGVSRLSKKLTRLEGAAFIDDALITLHEMGIPIVTNHDGMVCKVSDAQIVTRVLLEVLTNHLGFEPKIKVKASTGITLSESSKSDLDEIQLAA